MTDFSSLKISNLVASQLPQHITNEFTTFVSFVEAYYEYLEQSGKLTDVLNNFRNFIDIDYITEADIPIIPSYLVGNNFQLGMSILGVTDEVTPSYIPNFMEFFRRQYLNIIPKNILADKGKLLKHIKQFYTSRGTEKSFKFLFKILYNEDIQLFNTGSQILKLSDAKWFQPSVIRIATSNNLNDWISTQIFGTQSFATGVVDTATLNFQNNFQYSELSLNNITKNFLSNEVITAGTIDGKTLYGQILSVVPDIEVIFPGSKYNVGDPVIITGGGGSNASAIISEVSSGSLVEIGIIRSGAGFEVFPNFDVNIVGSSTSTLAEVLTVDTSGTRQPNSYQINNDIILPNANTAIVANSKIVISNTLSYITYGSTGPIVLIHVFDGGTNFTSPPEISVTANSTIGATNTRIKDYGTIGTYNIVNGGVNYQVNNAVKVINITSRGAAAEAIVTSVDANGKITGVLSSLPSISGTANVTSGSNVVIGTGTTFVTDLVANTDPTYPGSGTYIVINGEHRRVANITNNTFLRVNNNFVNTINNQYIRLDGFLIGGIGYNQSELPNGVSVSVSSQTGSGAVILADSILGDGATFNPIGGSYGQIKNISMTNFGDSYNSAPDVDLTQSGDGFALARADFIGGVFKYPGIFLNQDSMLDSDRFIENATKYNDYSYTITSKVPVDSYYQLAHNILNPVGSNMIGITRIYADSGILDINLGYDKFLNPSNNNFLDTNFILDVSILL